MACNRVLITFLFCAKKKSNKPRAALALDACAIALASEHGEARKGHFGEQHNTPKKLSDVILGGITLYQNKMRRKAI